MEGEGALTSTADQHLVMVGLVPTIHPSANSGACAALDPRDKPEDDTGTFRWRQRTDTKSQWEKRI
jgi:hypothetical protein